MKELLILSGKGGTGKTTTAAAFIAFANARAFADCDVDAPNLHLLNNFPEPPEMNPYYGGQKAVIDPTCCTNCQTCAEACRFEAIEVNANGVAVNPISCEGCGVCTLVCPVGAVTLSDDLAGMQSLYREERIFSTARLKMGRGNSGKLVTEVKKALANASDADFAVIDGSPGIGCPVIASVSGVQMVLVVAEPSLSGQSDMMRIIETCRRFGTMVAVCVNKADISPERTEAIRIECAENDVPFLGTVPYDSAVPEALNHGKSIAELDCPAKKALYSIYERVMILMND